jgi:hypothetical protein
MKRHLQLIFLLTLGLAGCQKPPEIRLHVRNPLDQFRKDAIVLLTRSSIDQWMDLEDGVLPMLYGPTGDPVPCQWDDVNGDGAWDELFALTDLEALGQKTLTLRPVASDQVPAFQWRTNLRLGANRPGYPELLKADRLEGITYHNHSRTGEVYQMEGPAWENDKVGFRNYLDQRNGMDIFGKLTAQMVLDSVGIAGRQSYHEPDSWGMDILKVNTSLGAGAIGYLYNDSIYRVGDNGSGTYEVVFEGPLRSRFNLIYDPWEIAGMRIKVVHQVEIVAGRLCYQSQVTRSGSGEDLDLVTGIVNILSDSLVVLDLDAQYTGVMTHDLQAEDTTLLAMALVVSKMELLSYGEAPSSGDGITETYYVVLDAPENQPVPYRFYALWERQDPRWAHPEEAEDFLKQEAERWTQSVTIEVEP